MFALSALLPKRSGDDWTGLARPVAPGGGATAPMSAAASPLPFGHAVQARWACAAGIALILLVGGPLQTAIAASGGLTQVEAAGLQCRLGSGPWQPCRMEVEDVGLHWVLRIGPQRIEFRHNGDGAVRMQKGAGPWQPVTATWQPDTSLCWDGVCARGDIPLD